LPVISADRKRYPAARPHWQHSKTRKKAKYCLNEFNKNGKTYGPVTPYQQNCHSNTLTRNEKLKKNLKTDTIRTQIKLSQLAARTVWTRISNKTIRQWVQYRLVTMLLVI